MSVSSYPNSAHQVFIRGIDLDKFGLGRAMIYTATVDFEKAKIDDLFQAISYRTGIQMSLLKYQFRFIRADGSQLITDSTLAFQKVHKEETFHLEWRSGLADNNECLLCCEKISSVSRRLLCCKQELADGTVQMQIHRTAIDVQCLEKLTKDRETECPLCRGKVIADAMIIP